MKELNKNVIYSLKGMTRIQAIHLAYRLSKLDDSWSVDDWYCIYRRDESNLVHVRDMVESRSSWKILSAEETESIHPGSTASWEFPPTVPVITMFGSHDLAPVPMADLDPDLVYDVSGLGFHQLYMLSKWVYESNKLDGVCPYHYFARLCVLANTGLSLKKSECDGSWTFELVRPNANALDLFENERHTIQNSLPIQDLLRLADQRDWNAYQLAAVARIEFATKTGKINKCIKSAIEILNYWIENHEDSQSNI